MHRMTTWRTAGANPAIQPYPLTPTQRLGVGQYRALMALLTPLARLRHAGGDCARELRRYGTRRAETLEVIHPKRHRPELGAVVFLHGGGWICGRKELYSGDLDFLCQRGHRVFNLDYPLAPEHPHPLPLIALIQALAWIRHRHPELEAVHLMGTSAGGNLALMLGLLLAQRDLCDALDPSLRTLDLPRPRSVVSLYGVLDRLSWLERGFPGARLMLHCYGGRGAFETQVGPEGALTPLDLEFDSHPPCFIACGTRDRLAESSRLAHERLKASRGALRFAQYEGEGHGFFSTSWRPNSARLRRDIANFLDGV